MDKFQISRLVGLIEQGLKDSPAAKPDLRIVASRPEKSLFDAITRDAHLKRIRYLARAYRLRWLVDQETFHVAALECLEDAELSKLLADMERARECMSDDVSFEEAGLVRSRAG